MSTKSILLGSICALVLGAASPALADNFSGLLSADYNKIDIKNSGGGSGDVWGVSGQGAGMLGNTGASGQIDGGWHRFTAMGEHAELWNIDGSLFAMVNKGGRIGATVGYDSVHADGFSAHATNYGLFAEWWANDMLTLGGKIGGFDGKGANGYYGSALLRGYYMPDLALNASIDYSHTNNNGDATGFTGSAEYLISETMPISVGAGASYTDLAGIHANTYFLTLNYYCNGDTGAETLRDRQRAGGTLGWDTGFGALLTKF
ncbi:MAG TPA: hypothetical protein VGT78_00790 [Rhizomicrobium sp.]|nr:hypothetical protein [Rhizomicrobium sp.]